MPTASPDTGLIVTNVFETLPEMRDPQITIPWMIVVFSGLGADDGDVPETISLPVLVPV